MLTTPTEGAGAADAVLAPHSLAAARAFVAHEMSVAPVPPDGSKRPRISWKPYQRRLPADDELVSWFASGKNGVAVLCGRVSGGLEVIDFDDDTLFAPWCALVESQLPDLLTGLPIVQSPGPGYHVYLRCPHLLQTAQPWGNQKLAQALGSDGRPCTLIETRAEGGLVLTPACPAGCHPSGRRYRLLQGDLCRVPVVTLEERGVLLDAARSFTRYVAPRDVVTGAPAQLRPQGGPGNPVGLPGRRPGDRFNATVAWPAILEPHGWRCLREAADGTAHWRRPGKTGRGWSATTNHAGSDLLYVFSSNAAPFEPERAYTKFAAYVLLDFGGDFRAAARALASRTSTGVCPRHRLSRHHAAPTLAPVAGPAGARPGLPRPPGVLIRRPDGTTVRRLPPLVRPSGVPLPPPQRPHGSSGGGELLSVHAEWRSCDPSGPPPGPAQSRRLNEGQ